MSYITNITITVETSDEKVREQFAECMKKDFPCCAIDDGWPDRIICSTESYHTLDDSDFAGIKTLCLQHPDVVVEVTGQGEQPDDKWSLRMKAAEKELVNAQITWPPFLRIVKKGEPNGPEPEKVFEECISKLKGLKGSNYWPFRSPNPCTTEKRLIDAVNRAINALETARDVDSILYGEEGKANRYSAPSTVITQHK